MVAVSVKGVVLVLCLLLVIFLATLLIPPALVFFPINYPLYRRLNDWSVAQWFRLIPGLFEMVFGVKVRICGDLRPVKGPCVFIMNHRTRFDWMFFWCYLIRMGNPNRHKIVLKSSLKKIPSLGWGMQAGQFLFLSRKWANDERYMQESLRHFSNRQYPIELLFFPEGTDLSPSNKMKSQQFAEKNNLPKYDYVLHPRTTGFVHCLQEMRKGSIMPSVINVSIAYVGAIPQNERDIVAGNWPREIHFCTHHMAASEIPQDNRGLEEWLKQQWGEKEKQLESFYANKKFDEAYMGEEDMNKPRPIMIRIMIFWCAYFLGVVYSLYYSSLFCWFFFFTFVFLGVINAFTDGMDCLVLKLYK